MDRTVTVAVILVAALIGVMLWFGWHKIMPTTPSTVSLAPSPSATPRLVYPDKPAVLSEKKPEIAPLDEDEYWLWDGALLTTGSLEDLLTFNQENDRPPIGYPNGTSRNQSGQTPKQRQLLASGAIVQIPTAVRTDVVSWGADDLVQVRVRDGEKAGTIGWINRHQLRYNHNGKFDSAFPVEVH